MALALPLWLPKSEETQPPRGIGKPAPAAGVVEQMEAPGNWALVSVANRRRRMVEAEGETLSRPVVRRSRYELHT